MKTDLGGAPADLDTRRAYARALLDRHYRRQAQMSEEAENQKRGDHDPAFLEAKSISGGREPPRLLRDCLPMASLHDAYSHDDGWRGELSDTIAQAAETQSENDILIVRSGPSGRL